MFGQKESEKEKSPKFEIKMTDDWYPVVETAESFKIGDKVITFFDKAGNAVDWYGLDQFITIQVNDDV